MRGRLALIFFVALLWIAGLLVSASAHQINLSSARLVLSADRRVALELAMKGSDADRVAGTRIFDAHTGLVDASRLAASAAAITAYIAAHATVVGAGGEACKADPIALTADDDGIIARLQWACETVSGDLIYRSTVLVDIEPAAKQVVLIGAGAEASQALLDAERTELRLTAPPPSSLEVATRYLEAGIEHIFLGYDHIAFLIAVVLWARRLWPLIKIVTAFTLAHSITLSLAALEIVTIPSAIVEPAIAASIVYVAVENFFSRNVEKRWRDALGFGLIHGFGFASALREFGLPRHNLLPALGSFNLGVEVGQIAIVSLVFPALIVFDRAFAASIYTRRSRTALVYAMSGAIAALGCYWIIERTLLA